ncbi:hypothetical protein BDV06DRAFT_212821 [Aspergillus oleicola]
MSTYRKSRSQSSLPEPDYGGLEVRCAWNGEYEQQADIKISLEVHCVPNTQLQLLDLRGPGACLKYYALQKLPSTAEQEPDDFEDTDAPLSPLFGFSPFGGDGTCDLVPPPSDASVFDDIPTAQSKPSLEQDEESDVTDQNAHDDASFYDAEPALESPSSLESTTRPLSSSPEPDFEGSTKSRKRSATDADFPDSGSDADNERTGLLKAITNRKARLKSYIATTSGDRTTGQALPEPVNQREVASPRSPKKSAPTKIPSLVVANDSASPKSPHKFPESPKKSAMKPSLDKLNESAVLQSPDKQAGSPAKPGPTRIPGFGIQDEPTSTSYLEASESPALKEFADTMIGSHFAQKGTIWNPVIEAPRVRFQTENGQSLSPIQTENSEADIERKNIETSTIRHMRESPRAPNYLREPSRAQKHIDIDLPESSDQPELRTIDGLVTLTNSGRVQPAKFRVTVTAALSMMYPDEKGWTELEVLGIPRTGDGKPGFLYFLMPQDRGLEIQTTAVGRITLVENCLMADFISTGDLIIPLGFIVDHDIVSHNISAIQMMCHASCSVMLNNRFLWTDKCVVDLYVDGGPEGCYECDIYITAKEGTQVGLSRLRVTCSPQDLDRFYVRWALDFPGVIATYWAPRIYSTPPEKSKNDHRHDLLEILNGPSKLYSGTEAMEVENNSDNQPNLDHDDVELTSNLMDETSAYMLSQSAPTQSIMTRIRQAIQEQFSSCDQDSWNFLDWLLMGVICLAILWVGIAMSAKSSGAMVHYPVHAPEYPISISLPHYRDSPENSQECVEQEPSTGGPGILDKYRATDTDGKIEAFVGSDKEQSGTMMGEGTEKHAASSIPIRDRIDYWLGWTGPL